MAAHHSGARLASQASRSGRQLQGRRAVVGYGPRECQGRGPKPFFGPAHSSSPSSRASSASAREVVDLTVPALMFMDRATSAGARSA